MNYFPISPNSIVTEFITIAKTIRDEDYTARELTVRTLRESIFSQLKDGGFSARELLAADFPTASDLRIGGYSAGDVRGDFTASDLRTVG